MSATPMGSPARLRQLSPPAFWLVAVTAVAVLWPIYVYGSSQAAWLAATGLLAVLAWDLSARRSPLLAGLLLAIVAILGTEANGALAAGHAPLGTLRSLDVVLVAALAARLREAWPLTRPSRPAAPLLIIVALGVYALALWALNGRPTDGLVRADVRLAGLVALTWVVVRDLGPWNVRQVARAGAIVVLLTAAKAVALYAVGYWTIGTYDRVQATTAQPPGDALRIILLGGDSLMIIAPACLLALGVAIPERASRWLLATAAGGALVGVLASGTRTSLLIALLLLAGVAAAHLLLRRRRLPSRRMVAAVLVAGGLLIGGATTMGVTERFTQSDAPGTGLDFRRQEIRSFLDLPIRDLLAGQGFGGRYVGESVLGLPVQAGWSHFLPVFIALKIGLVGLLATIGLLVTAAVRSARAYARCDDLADRATMACATTAIAGTLAMSFTLGRAALPEGAMILVLALAMLTTSRPRRRCEP